MTKLINQHEREIEIMEIAPNEVQLISLRLGLLVLSTAVALVIGIAALIHRSRLQGRRHDFERNQYLKLKLEEFALALKQSNYDVYKKLDHIVRSAETMRFEPYLANDGIASHTCIVLSNLYFPTLNEKVAYLYELEMSALERFQRMIDLRQEPETFYNSKTYGDYLQAYDDCRDATVALSKAFD